MGLRCLIGHDFGEPQIERDRDEQGDEVVVTIREFKECARCGHRRTVSENKEITSLPPSEPETDPAPEESTPSASTGPTGESFEDMSAEEDDGVILEDEPDEPSGRGHGEWPDADVEDEPAAAATLTPNGEVEPTTETADDDAGSDDPESADTEEPSTEEPESSPEPATIEADTDHPWPEVEEGDDQGYDAEASDGESPSDAFADDYSTATTDDASTSGEMIETAPTGSGSGIVSDNPGPTPGHQQRETPGVETEFVCPSCDHRMASDGSSLRPGDICPECGKGYLAERESDGSRNK